MILFDLQIQTAFTLQIKAINIYSLVKGNAYSTELHSQESFVGCMVTSGLGGGEVNTKRALKRN